MKFASLVSISSGSIVFNQVGLDNIYQAWSSRPSDLFRQAVFVTFRSISVFALRELGSNPLQTDLIGVVVRAPSYDGKSSFH